MALRRRGRPPGANSEKSHRALALYREGHSVDAIARQVGVSRATFYRYKHGWAVPELRVGILDYFGLSTPRYNRFPNGAHPGFFDVQVAKLMAQWLGARINFKPLPFVDLLTGVEQGELDLGIGLICASSPRRTRFSFSEAYANLAAKADAAFVARKTCSISFTDPRSWQGLRVGAVTASMNHEWLLENLPGVQLKTFNRQLNCEQALLSNQVDAVVDSLPFMKYFVETHGEFEIKPPLVRHGATVGMIVRRDDDQLLDRVSSCLVDLKRRHVLEPLEERLHFNGEMP